MRAWALKYSGANEESSGIASCLPRPTTRSYGSLAALSPGLSPIHFQCREGGAAAFLIYTDCVCFIPLSTLNGNTDESENARVPTCRQKVTVAVYENIVFPCQRLIIWTRVGRLSWLRSNSTSIHTHICIMHAVFVRLSWWDFFGSKHPHFERLYHSPVFRCIVCISSAMAQQ